MRRHVLWPGGGGATSGDWILRRGLQPRLQRRPQRRGAAGELLRGVRATPRVGFNALTPPPPCCAPQALQAAVLWLIDSGAVYTRSSSADFPPSDGSGRPQCAATLALSKQQLAAVGTAAALDLTDLAGIYVVMGIGIGSSLAQRLRLRCWEGRVRFLQRCLSPQPPAAAAAAAAAAGPMAAALKRRGTAKRRLAARQRRCGAGVRPEVPARLPCCSAERSEMGPSSRRRRVHRVGPCSHKCPLRCSSGLSRPVGAKRETGRETFLLIARETDTAFCSSFCDRAWLGPPRKRRVCNNEKSPHEKISSVGAGSSWSSSTDDRRARAD